MMLLSPQDQETIAYPYVIANGCTAARTTAEELIRLYHQLPR
jgi:hypothetical protein